MYQEALRTLHRKLGQPRAVVGAYLEELSNYPAVKMHSSDSIVSYASVITSLVSVFQSLSYEADLKSASLLNLAVSKIPPNIKEDGPCIPLRGTCFVRHCLTSIHGSKKKPKLMKGCERFQRKLLRRSSPPRSSSKKTASKVFASTTEQRKITKISTSQEPRKSVICLVCKANHPLWRCTLFKEKTATQRSKIVAENQLCYSCFQANHSVHSRENVRRTVATADTTPCCTVLKAYFSAKRGARRQLVKTLVSM